MCLIFLVVEYCALCEVQYESLRGHVVALKKKKLKLWYSPKITT